MRARVFVGSLCAVASLVIVALPASAQSPYWGGPYTNWSGFYVGGHVGGAWADADWNHANPLPTQPISTSPSGFVGGGQIGWQHQWGPWVGGLELSFSGADLNETVNSTVVADRSRSVDIDNIFLAGVRLGYAMSRSLLYVKGGYASAEVDISSNVVSTGQLTSTSSKRENGWNIGVGWEYALSPHLVAGIQYDFIGLDGTDRLNTQTPAFAGSTTHHLDVDVDIQTVTARLSYKFGGEEAARPLK